MTSVQSPYRKFRTRTWRLFALSLSALALLGRNAHCSPLDQWSVLVPRSEWPGTITDLAHSEGKWVGVGETGTIITSEDGLNWKLQTINHTCYSAALGSGVWLAVGTAIARSTNGVEWTLLPSPFSRGTSVAYGNGTFVLAGSGGIYYSPDGIDWIPSDETNVVRKVQVIFADGRFLLASGSRFMISIDGKHWDVRLAGRANTTIAAGNGRIVMLGSGVQETVAFASTNGLDWVEAARFRGHSDDSAKLIYGNGMFVHKGGTEIAWSADGLTWTRIFNVGYPAAAGFGDGKFVALGRTSLAYSTNGVSWTQVYGRPFVDVFAFAEGNDRLVAVGRYGTYVKQAEKDWLMTDSGGLNVTFHNGSFYRVGPELPLSKSADGLEWRDIFSMGDASSTRSLNAIVFGKDLLVAVGLNKITISEDGERWENPALNGAPLPNLHDVAYGNGRFVAVGEGQQNAAISQDGRAWTTFTLGANQPFLAIEFGNDQFVATGANVVAVSRDGLAWVTNSLVGVGWSLAYGNGVYLLRQDGSFYNSKNGLNWKQQSSPGGTRGGHLFHWKNQFIVHSDSVVDDGGATIFKSGRLDLVRLEPRSEGETFTIIGKGGELGRTYELQAAQSLSDGSWENTGTFTNRVGFFDEVTFEPPEGASPSLFFRARSTE